MGGNPQENPAYKMDMSGFESGQPAQSSSAVEDPAAADAQAAQPQSESESGPKKAYDMDMSSFESGQPAQGGSAVSAPAAASPTWDEEMDAYLDELLAYFEQQGRLYDLDKAVQQLDEVDLAEFSTVTQTVLDAPATAPSPPPDEPATVEGETDGEGEGVAETAAEQLPPEPPPRRTTREIREAIFAKIRRPEGTPYTPGYEVGPAERLPEYEGEEYRTGDRLGKNQPAEIKESDRVLVTYEPRETIDDRAVRGDGAGRLLDNEGKPIDGTFCFVVDDQTGLLLLVPVRLTELIKDGDRERVKDWDEAALKKKIMDEGYKMRATRHTTPVAGMAVTSAGEIVVEQGYVKSINDLSGHYRPDAAQQYTAVSRMEENFDLSRAKVELTGRETELGRTGKADWLEAAREQNRSFPVDEVGLREWQFTQTQGDEYQIRAKQAVNRQIEQLGQTPATNEGTDGTGPSANERWLEEARDYLRTAGPSPFAEWLRTLDKDSQEKLVADPEIARIWQSGPQTIRPAWQPRMDDHIAASRTNAAVIDALKDRGSATFSLGGGMLLIGGGHDGQHITYVTGSPDAVTGRVTVRKAGLGRGAGSLTFTGVPPSGRDHVKKSVVYFSQKRVIFE